MWTTIESKVRGGMRLSPEEGVYLLREAPLLELGALAQEMRARRTDPRVVTYVIDTNPELHQRLHGGLPLLRLLPQALAHARPTPTRTTSKA